MEKVKQWRNALIGHYEGDQWVMIDKWKPIETRPRNADGITFRSVILLEENEFNNLTAEREYLSDFKQALKAEIENKSKKGYDFYTMAEILELIETCKP